MRSIKFKVWDTVDNEMTDWEEIRIFPHEKLLIDVFEGDVERYKYLQFIGKKDSENKDLYTLFNYLNKRGFDNFPKLIKNFRDEENLFEYVEEEQIFEEQKLLEMSSVVASLHNKTVYFKKTKLKYI